MKTLLLLTGLMTGVLWVPAAEPATAPAQIDWGQPSKPVGWAMAPEAGADVAGPDKPADPGEETRGPGPSGGYGARLAYGVPVPEPGEDSDGAGETGLGRAAAAPSLEVPSSEPEPTAGSLRPGVTVLGSSGTPKSRTSADAEDGRWDREAAHLDAIPLHEVAAGLGVALGERTRLGVAYRYIGADAQWDQKGEGSPWSAAPILVEKEQNHGGVLTLVFGF